MKIAVATPAGHIGKVVAEKLLSAGASVVLLARDPSKLKPFTDRGATVAQGSLEEGPYVVEATQGVDALFWLTPPRMDAPHFRGYQNGLAHIAAAAVRKNRIPRVVNLSSIGAQHSAGVGPVSGLHDVERILDQDAQNITHVRPAFFFENFLWQVAPMKAAGSIFMPLPPDARLPMIATRDIAKAVASRLLDATWTGRSVMHLFGPADLTLTEAARIISEGVGRTVAYVQVPREAALKSLREAGASEDVANVMVEMYDGMAKGLLRPETPRTAASTTSTTLLQFAREVIRPLVA